MSSNCSTALACIDGSNSSKRSLPFAFAQYIAASALRRSSSVDVGSVPEVSAMPMLPPSDTSRP
jgi:hypothetical protein